MGGMLIIQRNEYEKQIVLLFRICAGWMLEKHKKLHDKTSFKKNVVRCPRT